MKLFSGARIWLVRTLWIVLVSSVLPLRAAEATTNQQPHHVTVGIYLTRIPSISLRENRFAVDFYVWLRWLDEQKFEPQKTIELVGGEITRREVQTEEVTNGLKIVTMRIQANITKVWDVTRYPLDTHNLEIIFEDSASDETALTYSADTANSHCEDKLSVNGWFLGKMSGLTTKHVYHTNWGMPNDPADSESNYSQAHFIVPIKRESGWFAIRMLYGPCIATVLALAALFISCHYPPPRFALPVGAIFATIASHFVVANSLPEHAQPAFVDTVHIMAAMLILLVVIESVWSLIVYRSGKEKSSARLFAELSACNSWRAHLRVRRDCSPRVRFRDRAAYTPVGATLPPA